MYSANNFRHAVIHESTVHILLLRRNWPQSDKHSEKQAFARWVLHLSNLYTHRPLPNNELLVEYRQHLRRLYQPPNVPYYFQNHQKRPASHKFAYISQNVLY